MMTGIPSRQRSISLFSGFALATGSARSIGMTAMSHSVTSGGIVCLAQGLKSKWGKVRRNIRAVGLRK